MAHELLQVDSDPAQAVAEIREASRSRPVLVFKRSPICPVSHRAEFELRKYLEGLGDDASLAVVDIDVIGAKPLARGLTQTLGIDHESPPGTLVRRRRARLARQPLGVDRVLLQSTAVGPDSRVSAGGQAASIRLRVALVLFAAIAIASSRGPSDRTTWLLEIAPVFIAAPLMALTARRFPLTPLLTWLAVVHAAILGLGAAYTYAEVPLGFWLRDFLDFERNPYDRIGHIAQGFVPAILAREVLLRTSPLSRGPWLAFLIVCVCLAFSAFYELIEWWAAVAGGEAADAFLGTQGDVWDTQWDMFLALCGAITSLLLLSRVHDAQLSRLPSSD